MKQKLIDFLQCFLFYYFMLMGSVGTYAVAWVKIGLPVDWWANLIVFALSILTKWGYIEWLKN